MHAIHGGIENTGMHYMYGCANGKGISSLRMYYAQLPDRRTPDHKTFQWLHRLLHEIRSFQVTRHDAGRRRAVRISSLEEGTLNVVARQVHEVYLITKV
ncbi:hypothetical protein TNCV_1205201 [Trichonephila clavipes]|nr:hypothetical protein TNCV_1205201 [Trichonephila clavipes]